MSTQPGPILSAKARSEGEGLALEIPENNDNNKYHTIIIIDAYCSSVLLQVLKYVNTEANYSIQVILYPAKQLGYSTRIVPLF